mmetsp:Transcript_52705/g.104715  ORF Transcript_52705/g.104715 Transcript_52705/m.104715 type:complete len:420 (-) Transcript_52705:56-1315(-)
MPAPLAAPVAYAAAAAVAVVALFLGGGAQKYFAQREEPAEDVPLIELQSMRHDYTGRNLRRAAMHLGVFRLSGHGVDIDAVLNASQTFFKQSAGVKRSARSRSGGSGGFERGYIPLAGESGLRHFVELKEGFCYGKDGGEATSAEQTPCEQLLIKPNAWPTEAAVADDDAEASSSSPTSAALGEAWRRVLLDFLDASITLTDEVGMALSTAMGRDPSFVGKLAAGGEDISLMRLFHYFPPSHEPSLAPGVPRTGSSPHTDWHLMTIVLQDQTGGLQVRRSSPPFAWVDVPALPGELIIIIGDYISALSEGLFVSPVHRVNLPHKPSEPERFSATFFRYPHCNATVPEAAAKRAERRAAKSARRLQQYTRQVNGQGRASEPFNTLVRAQPEGAGWGTLATTPFGELLVEKWRGVASNKQL